MTIWAKDDATEISIGINCDGDLFLGNSDSGYNLRDTPENREHIKQDYRYYTGKKYVKGS